MHQEASTSKVRMVEVAAEAATKRKQEYFNDLRQKALRGDAPARALAEKMDKVGISKWTDQLQGEVIEQVVQKAMSESGYDMGQTDSREVDLEKVMDKLHTQAISKEEVVNVIQQASQVAKIRQLSEQADWSARILNRRINEVGVHQWDPEMRKRSIMDIVKNDMNSEGVRVEDAGAVEKVFKQMRTQAITEQEVRSAVEALRREEKEERAEAKAKDLEERRSRLETRNRLPIASAIQSFFARRARRNHY